MQFDNFGSLMVRTLTAGGSLPIPHSIVKIKGASPENSTVSFSLLTDRDGITPKVNLPAPAGSYSLDPNTKNIPFGLYDIAVTSPEFYKQNIYSVAIFSGIDTVLPVNMIPHSIHENIEYPQENLDTVIFENLYR